MILHPIIDLLKRIVIALPDYAGGGGELPDGMNHTGSGEILFASRTQSTIEIYHGLDFTPLFVVAWCNDNYLSYNDMFYYCIANNLANNNGTVTSQRMIVYRSSVGAVYQANTDQNYSGYINNEFFRPDHGSYYYKAATSYYWFAFD